MSRVQIDLDALRREFDETFARAFGEVAQPALRLVAVRAGEAALALRLDQITRLAVGRRIVPVPGGSAELLGLVGVRDRVLPAFDLARLLGRGGGGSGWLAVAAGTPPFVVAFDELEGLREVQLGQLLASGDLGTAHVQAMVDDGAVRRMVIDLEALGASLGERFLRAGGRREGR